MAPHPVYFDNAATSWPKPPQVGRAMADFLRDAAGNPGRGGHALARAAAEPMERVRERLAGMINAPCARRVIMTGGCTDSVNLAIHGVLRGVLRACPSAPPRVVTTAAEHNAVTRTLHCYQSTRDIDLVIVPCDGRGFVDPAEFLAACTPCTVLACLTHASNAVGTLQDIASVGRGLPERSPDALFLVDAAQTAGHLPIDVQADAIDLLAIAGHKGLLGPTGTGALYVSPRAYGDDGSGRVFCQRRGGTGAVAPGLAMPTELPDALEAGTANAVGFAGLLAAIDARRPDWHRVETDRTAAILEGLADIDPVRVHGVDGLRGRTPVVLFTVEGRRARDVAAELDERFGLCVRGGTHCAPLLHEAIGTGEAGGVRVSPGWATTREEVDLLVAAVREIASLAAVR